MVRVCRGMAVLAAMFSLRCAGNLENIKEPEAPLCGGKPATGLEDKVKANYRLNAKYEDPVEINKILNIIEKVPDPLQQIANDYGGTIVIFDGILTDNESMREYKGKPIPKWSDGSTYDILPGVYSVTHKEALIKLNPPLGSHASISLELHEYGHLIDHALGSAFGLKEISAFSYFVKAHEISRAYRKPDGSLRMSNYSYYYRDEFFAESFARFYLSAETKGRLKADFPEAYGFLEHFDSSADSLADLDKLDEGSNKPDPVKYQERPAGKSVCIIQQESRT